MTKQEEALKLLEQIKATGSFESVQIAHQISDLLHADPTQAIQCPDCKAVLRIRLEHVAHAS